VGRLAAHWTVGDTNTWKKVHTCTCVTLCNDCAVLVDCQCDSHMSVQQTASFHTIANAMLQDTKR
jgi:hypothetical protein